ncbi:MAG: DUF4153 domain-containing protein [Brevundimonas mediterranea]|jgi:hypothetical protein|uniref:DUF4153 domain-containing protein n=1 Tax=Brevundimonas mediterranea TaxID=74329 RepID=A0AB37E407_9CAUL|nr:MULTISPECIES: DUF4153 domain-containing protein [Brevundimonas]EDX80209.1 hypothetical protein BBAL3_1366 [Brevundimonas sp. BAL3]MBA4331449.1 DUF4153 domain-containing protein [Brevundimonas sp.]QIH72031.1 DUF4153 domain-containing protein [Brevundimonas mediterranea]TAJ54996.1 MAG: DUF4153 domain-containing protein [Brevundimonas sp.]
MTTEAANILGTGWGGTTPDGDRRRIAIVRLTVGLVQGIVLYLLLRATEGDSASWSQRHPDLFAPALLTALFLPAVLLSGVGKLRLWVYVVWSLIAGLVLALLAWHDIARQADGAREATFPLFVFAAAALFIAHHLVVPADRERRLAASYPAYFDAAWMAGVQGVLSVGFAGAFWLLLLLGASLFKIIGLSFLSDLLQESWFSLPLTGLAFATAVHLTDVRDGLIRGVRTVALMLLSWLLLVITVLVGGFLLALPFTGLDGLWETGSATALVLSAAAALIVLINTAYQDGRPDHRPPVVLRYGVRVASALIAPLVGLAFWGLALRIGQHGLTPDRIIATACAVIGAVYGLGYLFAAVRPGPWMKPLEPTNILAAVLSVATILALFSPLADPARLSAADQVARLERGAVTAKDFDYEFLRFDSGKAGLAALDRLMRSPDAKTAELARVARAQEVRSGYSVEEQAERVKSIRIQPVPGQITPPSFTAQETLQDTLMYVCGGDKPCRLRTLDLDGDGRAEVLLATSGAILTFAQDAEDQWVQSAQYTAVCTRRPADDLTKPFAEAMTVAPSSLPDLVIGGQRLQAQPQISCPPPTPR